MYLPRGNIEYPTGKLFLWRKGKNRKRSILGTKRLKNKNKNMIGVHFLYFKTCNLQV